MKQNIDIDIEREIERQRDREREREAELIIFDLDDDTVMPYCMYIMRHLHILQQTGLKQRIYFQKLIKVRFEFLFIMGKKKKTKKMSKLKKILFYTYPNNYFD